MKIFAISDLHLSTVEPKPMDIFGGNWDDYWQKIECDWQQKVGDDDVVLIPGDTSWAMRMCDAIPDLEKIAKLKGKKVLLRGNHDYWWNTIGKVRNALPEGMFAVQNDCIRFGNLLVCGSRGWTCLTKGLLTNKTKKFIFARQKE